MGKLGTFLFGFVIGGAVVYTSLHYHIVRAGDGMHFIPKLSSTFSQTYVDIQGFGFNEWNEHRALAAAIGAAGKGELVQGVAAGSLQNAVDGAFRAVGLPLETAR